MHSAGQSPSKYLEMGLAPAPRGPYNQLMPNHKPPAVFKVVVTGTDPTRWDYAERHPQSPYMWVAQCECGWRCAPLDEEIQANSAAYVHMWLSSHIEGT